MFPRGPLAIPPLERPLDLDWSIPGSKSITNRALVLAALAQGTSTLSQVLHSDDTLHMKRSLEAIGVTCEELDATTLRVTGGLGVLRQPTEPLLVGNGGTSGRLFTRLSCLGPRHVPREGAEAREK